MSKKHDTPTIEVRFEFFPEAWSKGVAREIFTLLIGPDKLYPATRWGNEGKNLLPTKAEEIIEWLTDRYEYSHKSNRIPLFTNKSVRDFHFELFRSEWDENSTFGQLLHWPKDLMLSVPIDHFITLNGTEIINKVAKLTQAPLVAIDYRKSWSTEPITIESRREMRRVVKGIVHRSAAIGAWRGLDKIPWRLILGEHIVKTIRIEKLQNLPRDQAIDHGNGLWTLQTSVDPSDSITNQGRDTETQIIASLGKQFFADTEQNQLAQVLPRFPEKLVPQDTPLFERYGKQLNPL